MKAIVLAAVAAIITAVTPVAAQAQDFTGARIGVTGGYDDIQSREGFNYGVVVGVDAPVIKGVTLGVEATLEDSTTDTAGLDVSRDLGMNLRAGVAVLPKVQLFGKVGYASTRFDLTGNTGHVNFEGLRYGAGVEYAVSKHTYATLEYRRSEYEDNLGGRDGVLAGVGFRF